MESKDVYSSRWRYVWAEPVYRESPDRIPVAAVILSTRSPQVESRLPIPDSAQYSASKLKLLQERLAAAGHAILVTPSI